MNASRCVVFFQLRYAICQMEHQWINRPFYLSAELHNIISVYTASENLKWKKGVFRVKSHLDLVFHARPKIGRCSRPGKAPNATFCLTKAIDDISSRTIALTGTASDCLSQNCVRFMRSQSKRKMFGLFWGECGLGRRMLVQYPVMTVT